MNDNVKQVTSLSKEMSDTEDEDYCKVKSVGADDPLMNDGDFIAKYIKLNCNICGEVKHNFKQLRKHFYSVHKNKDGYVICCEKKFTRHSKLLDHAKFHQNQDFFKCYICERVYTTRKALLEHKDGHAFEFLDKNSRKCGVCNQVFEKYSTLILHMNKIHKGIQPYECKACGRKFTFGFRFQKHISRQCVKIDESTVRPRNKESSEDRTCVLCRKVFKKVAVVKTHMHRIHGNILPFACETCGMGFRLRHSLQKHFLSYPMHSVKQTTQGKLLENFSTSAASKKPRQDRIDNDCTCIICKQIFTSEELLVEHLHVKHEAIKLFKCITCKQELFTSQAVQRHLLQSSNCTKSMKMFKANKIEQGNSADFEDKNNTRHQSPNEKNYIQGISDEEHNTLSSDNVEDDCFERKGFHSNNLLMNDLIKKNIALDCDLCGKTKKTFKDLKAHFQNAHNIQNGYAICCGKRFTVRGKLLDHAKFHENPDLFKCGICGKRATSRKNLSEHKDAHDFETLDEKFRKCGICSHVYKGYEGLKLHMYREHKGLQPYDCKACGRKFAFYFRFQKHISKECVGIADTYIEPQKMRDCEDRTCVMCKKVFKQVVVLRAHMQKHHNNISPFECEICEMAFPLRRSLQRHFIAQHNFLETTPDESEEAARQKPRKSLIDDDRTCVVCKKIFTTEEILEKHLQKSHQNVKPFKCKICKLELKTSRALHRHLLQTIACSAALSEGKKNISQNGTTLNETTTGENSFDDEQNDLDFSAGFSKNLEPSTAFISEDVPSEDGYDKFLGILEQCQEDFSSFGNEPQKVGEKEESENENLAIEELVDPNGDETDVFIAKYIEIQCALCGTKTDTFKMLQSHFQNEHDIQNGYVKCCKKRFTVRGKLLDHAKSHRNPNIFQCSICGKVLSSRKNLSEHNDDHEFAILGEASRTCCICNQVFEKYATIKTHMYKFHNGVQPYDCNACGRKFNLKYRFDKHIATECVGLNTKNLQPEDIRSLNDRTCVVCKKVFKGADVVKTHMFTKHKGIKPFKCYCGLEFVVRQSLERHAVRHQQLKALED